MFPLHRMTLVTAVLKMGRMLDSFGLKRDGGGTAKQAIAYTKADRIVMALCTRMLVRQVITTMRAYIQ